MGLQVIKGEGRPGTLMLSELIEYAQELYAKYGQIEVAVDDGENHVLWRIPEIGRHVLCGDEGKVVLALRLVETYKNHLRLVTNDNVVKLEQKDG